MEVENTTQNGLTIDCSPSGRNGTATLTAKLGSVALAVESVNLTKSKARAGFIDAVCNNRPGIDRQAVEAKLLQLAADLAAKPEAPADTLGMPELDAAAIVRPERFITPEVSGLAVPSVTTMGDKVQGRWLLYLRWADGKRERRPMAPAIELPDGRRLFIHPEPSEPTPNTKPGWSAAARKRWKARGVSEHLKRYGAVTHKSCGRKVYKVTLDSLRAIQESYGIDLGFDEKGDGA